MKTSTIFKSLNLILRLGSHKRAERGSDIREERIQMAREKHEMAKERHEANYGRKK